MNLMLGNWDTKFVPLVAMNGPYRKGWEPAGVSIQKGLDSRLVELSRYPILINRYARKPYQIEAGKLWTNQLDCLYQLAARGFWVEGFF